MRFPMLTTLSLSCLTLLMSVQESLQEQTVEYKQLKETIRLLTRQSILQQFHIEQQTRAGGCSGIKQQRVTSDGTRSYDSQGFSGRNVLGVEAIHNHPNFIRTVGHGEIVVVLNGVEFRTRHNDYELVRPSQTSSSYEKTEIIEYPPVPPEVLEKETVEDQIAEMKEWFIAFRDQNVSVRDYRPYFRPVISYLEGAWTYIEGEDAEIDEPFYSERHYVDAKTWYNLEEHNRYEGYTGFKHPNENTAYLPKKIIGIASNGTPIFAQWNYRILSHPLDFDVPLKNLRPVDDLQSRGSAGMTFERYIQSQFARFSVIPEDMDPSTESRTHNYFLDEIMGSIPGKDNYQGDLREDGYFGLMSDSLTGKPMNTAYYHRKFMKKLGNADPRKTQEHGFSDPCLFMAMTTQDKVVGMEDIRCATAKGKFTCDSAMKKWTYAIPLEIIYLTPLHNWNPYNLEYKGEADSPEGKTVTDGGNRIGSKSKPFDGTHSKFFLGVPHGFYFDDPGTNEFPKSGYYVLDRNNIPRAVMASGVTTILFTIPGVGKIRQRYPIVPVYDEGSVVWKELAVLKDMILKPKDYEYMYYKQDPDAEANEGSPDIELQTGLSVGYDNPHYHTLRISATDMENIIGGMTVTVITDQASGHTHRLKVVYNENAPDCDSHILWKRCDQAKQCFDNHPQCLEAPNI